MLMLVGALLTSCTTPRGILPPYDVHGYAPLSLHAVGARDATGAPEGDYRIVNSAGVTQAQGRFLDGKMEGKWVFFDSHQLKVAEAAYQRGAVVGLYRTYFGSAFTGVPAGQLESTGYLQNGQIVGLHVAYTGKGYPFSKATFKAGDLMQVEAGPADAATKIAEADIRFFRALEKSVKSAIR